jgi:hypothetical protein
VSVVSREFHLDLAPCGSSKHDPKSYRLTLSHVNDFGYSIIQQCVEPHNLECLGKPGVKLVDADAAPSCVFAKKRQIFPLFLVLRRRRRGDQHDETNRWHPSPQMADLLSWFVFA